MKDAREEQSLAMIYSHVPLAWNARLSKVMKCPSPKIEHAPEIIILVRNSIFFVLSLQIDVQVFSLLKVEIYRKPNS